MVDLASSHFHIDVHSLDEDRLKNFAGGLFEAWELWLADGLRLDDYSVRLEVSQGSLKGLGKVAAVAGMLYMGIGNYGPFRSGLSEIYSDLKRASDFLSEHALAPFSAKGRPRMTSRLGQGAVVQLERLFRRVEQGQLAPEKATQAAVALFAGEELPDGFVESLGRAFRSTPVDPQQMVLIEPASVPEDQVPSEPLGETRRPSPPQVVLPRMEVAIWRDSKRGAMKLQVLSR